MSFEEAFAEAERSAAAAVKAASLMLGSARQMQKAAQEGDISKLRKTVDRLVQATDAARQDVSNATGAWPFQEADERDYLANDYEAELVEEAARSGLKIHARDARLMAYPSILQIMPGDLAIKIGKKRVSTLRPGYLVRLLLANQRKKSRQSAERFIECLYATYQVIVPEAGLGTVAKLSQVYETLTLLPGSRNDYSLSDFALDLFTVDESGRSQTRTGAVLSLPASTGSKGSARDVITFVAPDGDVRTYYGLRFTEG